MQDTITLEPMKTVSEVIKETLAESEEEYYEISIDEIMSESEIEYDTDDGIRVRFAVLESGKIGFRLIA